VQRKALHAGTAGTRQHGRLAIHTTPGAHAPHLLPCPLAKGQALLHRGRQGLSELRRVIAPGIMPRGHHVIRASLQVSQPPQRAEVEAFAMQKSGQASMLVR